MGRDLRHDGADENQPMLRYFVYGNYIDEVLMMRNVLDDEAAIRNIDLYFVHDNLYNCRALVDEDGVIVERSRYDAYGNPHVRTISDMDGDGDTDGADQTIKNASLGKSECQAGYNWVADLNNDGATNFGDGPPIFGRFNGKSNANGYVSLFKNPYYFTGRRIDTLHGGSLTLQYNRNRYYDPVTGAWLGRDPLGVNDGLALFAFRANGRPGFKNGHASTWQYSDGMNLYSYVKNRPTRYGDSHGLLGRCGECFPPGNGKSKPWNVKVIGWAYSSGGLVRPSSVDGMLDAIGSLGLIGTVANAASVGASCAQGVTAIVTSVVDSDVGGKTVSADVVVEGVLKLSGKLGRIRGKYLWMQVEFTKCVECGGLGKWWSGGCKGKKTCRAGKKKKDTAMHPCRVRTNDLATVQSDEDAAAAKRDCLSAAVSNPDTPLRNHDSGY